MTHTGEPAGELRRGDADDVVPSRPIDWSEMRRLPERIAERLDPDEPVDMWIAGGSALASADLRLSTTDVDVVSEVPEAVYVVACDIADEVDLALRSASGSNDPMSRSSSTDR
ncbi:MAG: hypothetical protein AAGG08_02585 [Actinomycetota bacterium]